MSTERKILLSIPVVVAVLWSMVIRVSGAQTIRDHLASMPPQAPGVAKGTREVEIRLLLNQRSLSAEIPMLLNAVDHDPLFAPGTEARTWAFVCLSSPSDVNGPRTIADPVLLARLIRASLEEPRDTKVRVLQAFAHVSPDLAPQVNEALPAVLQDPDRMVVHGALNLLLARNIEPEPFVETARAIAESPATTIPFAWNATMQDEREFDSDGRFPMRGTARPTVRLRESAARVVIMRSTSIDDTVAHVMTLDLDTRLAYALALSASMINGGGPVFTASADAQVHVASLVSTAIHEWNQDYLVGNERTLGLRAFVESTAVSGQAKEVVAAALTQAADRIENSTNASANDIYLASTLRQMAALAP